MLQKNPEDRPTAKVALEHKWILKYLTEAEKDDIAKLEKESKFNDLNGVQENMKRFQEEFDRKLHMKFYPYFFFIIDVLMSNCQNHKILSLIVLC